MRYLLLSVMLLAGCSGKRKEPVKAEVKKIEVAVTPKPDPFSAGELVKKYPELQKVCDLAGGCDKVKIKCHSYDGSGDPDNILRNSTFVWVETDNENTYGIGEGANGTRFRVILDEAIREWMHKATNPEPPYVPKVAPKQTPCNEDCLK